MDVFFPEDHLARAVPEETKFIAVSIEPYPDGRRIHVNVEVTPFQKRPHLEFTLYNNKYQEIANTAIIEPLTWKFEFTMHIRGDILNPYQLDAKLFYPDGGPSAEPRSISFEVNPPPDSPEAESSE